MKKLLMPALLFSAMNVNASNLIIEMEQVPQIDTGWVESKNMTRGVCKIYDDGKAIVEFRTYDSDNSTIPAIIKNEQTLLSSSATFKINKKQITSLINDAKEYNDNGMGSLDKSAIYAYKNKIKTRLASGGNKYDTVDANSVIVDIANIMCNQHGLSVLNNHGEMPSYGPW